MKAYRLFVALFVVAGLVVFAADETQAFKRCVFLDCETHVSEAKATTTGAPDTDLSTLAPNNSSQNNGGGNGTGNGTNGLIVTSGDVTGLNLSDNTSNTEANTTAVPIPGTVLLFAAGFAAFVAWQHKKDQGHTSRRG